MLSFMRIALRTCSRRTSLTTWKSHELNGRPSISPRFFSAHTENGPQSPAESSESAAEAKKKPHQSTASTESTTTKARRARRGEHIKQVEALIGERHIRQAAELFLTQLTVESSPPEHLYETLIGECLAANLAGQAYDVYRLMHDQHLKVPQALVRRLILQCDEMGARAKKLKHLRKTIAVHGYTIDGQMYNAMIRCYIGDGQWKIGLSLAEAAKAKGLAIEDETMNGLLHAHGHEENTGFYRALEVWYEMKRRQCPVNTFGFNGLLRSIENCKQFDMTKMLESLDRITATLPDGGGCGAKMGAVESLAGSESKDMDQLGAEASSVGQLGAEPASFEASGGDAIGAEAASVDATSVDATSVDATNIDSASAEPPSVPPSSTAGGPDDGRPALLTDPRKLGRLFPLGSVTTPQHILLVLGGLTGILRELKSLAIRPNEETILTLLAIAPNSAAVEHKIYTLTQAHKVSATEEPFFDKLLERRCLRRDFPATLDIIDAMRSVGSEVDLGVYGMLAAACQTVNDAQVFFQELDEHNIELNTHIIHAMLTNAIRAKDNDYVIEILRQAKAHNAEPTNETVDLIQQYQQQAAARLKELHRMTKHEQNECFKVLREVKQYFHQFNIRSAGMDWADDDEAHKAAKQRGDARRSKEKERSDKRFGERVERDKKVQRMLAKNVGKMERVADSEKGDYLEAAKTGGSKK